jgi:hypothetical protein
MRMLFCTILAVIPLCCSAQDGFFGRWNLTVRGDQSGWGGWVELSRTGEKPTLRVLGRVGNAKPVEDFDLTGNRLTFSTKEYFQQTERVDYDLTVEGDRLTGTAQRESGKRMEISGVRAPLLKRDPPKRWGPPVALLEGAGLGNWQSVSGDLASWTLKDGVLANNGKAPNLRSKAEFEDFKLSLEFNCPAGSNSGVYLRGRYEIQIMETGRGGGSPLNRTGALYGHFAPRVDVAAKPGEWRKLEATLVGRSVTVSLDGVTIIDGEDIPGPTGGNLNTHEEKPGPIMLQGDHGVISFRNIVVTPAVR